MSRYLIFLLLGASLTICFCTYKDYGISWDENDQRHLGLVTYHYFSYGRDSLLKCDNNKYGAAFEYPLIIIEKTLNLQDTRQIYLMRHMVTHLFFLSGALAFFLLIDYFYKNKWLAVFGFLLLVTHPVVYSHSFYNSKDMAFLVMYCICYLLVVIAFDKDKPEYYILSGIACGLLTNLRIMGCLLVVCLSLFFLIDYIQFFKDKKHRRNIGKSFCYFILPALIILYITSPYLYPNPVQNIVFVFREMAHHYPVNLIFDGKSVNPQNIPWYAITVFGISTPLVYLALGVAGIIILMIQFIKIPLHFIKDRKDRNILLFAIGFYAPLISIILFHSEIFDGWRHLLFIYPSFVLLCIYGLSQLFKTKAKWLFAAVVAGGICFSIGYIISNFPYENVYFNLLAGNHSPENLRKKWETDYWGNSYYQALEYIVSHDTAANINVQAVWVGQENGWLLKPEDRKRIHFTGGSPPPDYFVSWYKNHPGDFDFENKEVFSIKVENSKIISVFKFQ